MIVPMIHRNGTSKDELKIGLMNVSNALHDAERLLRAATPHGRDYYLQGNEALKKAILEHEFRLSRIGSIQAEIDTMMLAIDQQEA